MKMSHFLLVLMLLSTLSACGMQGDLYLPDEKDSDKKNKTEKQGAVDGASPIILNVVYKA